MQIDFFLTLQKVAVLFILIVIGFIAGRSNIISEKGQKDITHLVLYITMPTSIFSAMQMEMNPDLFRTSFNILGIMIISYLFIFCIGLIITRTLPLKNNQKDIFQTALLLSNTSFMGYPIIKNLLGPEALFYAVVGAGFVFEVVSWSLGVYLISRNGTESAGFNWKKVVFSPGILSIVIGLLFFVT